MTYGPRKESVPLIEAAAVTPSSFTFGDSITLTATVKRPANHAHHAELRGGRGRPNVKHQEKIPIGGTEQKVSQSLFIPLFKQSARQRGDACKTYWQPTR